MSFIFRMMTKPQKAKFLSVLVLFFCLISNFAFAALPKVETISPSSGVTPPDVANTFTCTYSDANGQTDLKEAYLLISTSSSKLTNSVYLYYDVIGNQLFLRNDANTVWLPGGPPGFPSTVENSYVRLNCASTAVSGSANTLTVSWNVTFKPTYSGKTYNTYLKVRDRAGGYAGWSQRGTYGISYSPAADTITPSSGTGWIHVPQVFTTTYSDPDGWQNIRYVYFLMNMSTSGSNCLYAYYNQNTNKFYLRNDTDTAWLGGYAPGSSNTVENSYVKLYCASSTFLGSGTTLTVNWSVNFKSAFIGTKNAYLYVIDDAGIFEDWTQKGTWTIESDITSPTGTIIDYSYDDLNRLRNVTHNGTNTTYTYDEVGNIINETTVGGVP